MLEASVTKLFGSFSLDAKMADPGFTCLSGRNGSGKTTFMRIMAGLIEPDGGYVRVNGLEVTDLPVERRGVVFVTPASFIPSLQVDAHLRWGAALRGRDIADDELRACKEELGIDIQGVVGKLSLGMRERVSLSTALLSSPAVILVDEAFSNLHERKEFISSYRALCSKAGVDVVFSTQDDSDGELSEHLYLIEDGKTCKKF
jgi:molybdate/tungstate transport system ATP-binding protein